MINTFLFLNLLNNEEFKTKTERKNTIKIQKKIHDCKILTFYIKW